LCHEQDVRIDEGKMLSERENFDWGDLKRDGERVVFSLPPVVKTLRRFAEEHAKLSLSVFRTLVGLKSVDQYHRAAKLNFSMISCSAS
jgi:hypothetical protein